MKKLTIKKGCDHTQLRELVELRQKISREILNALERSAAESGVSVELEVASRLLATFTEPEAFGLESMLEEILKQDFSDKDAVAECSCKRRNWQYIYEVEKLTLFLEFETRLPRTFKENFNLIDVKEATKQIKAGMKTKDDLK